MPRYRASIDAPLDAAAAFDYLADFSTTQEWDPGVSEASMRTPAPVGLGSQFHVVASFAGRKVPLTYEITAFERPDRFTVRAENGSTISEDTITVLPAAIDGGPVTVQYDAELRLKGAFRALEPVMGLLFNGIGDRAAAGLRVALATRAGRPPEA